MARPKRNPDIKYINPDIPDFELPEFKGTRYEATIPDTLDLAERAAQSVHVMTASTDPQANAEIYWRANFGWKPQCMYHDGNDSCEYKYFAPSLLLRQACGSDEGFDVEWHRMATTFQMQAPDGLLYIPLVGRPWGTEFSPGGETFETQAREHMLLMGPFGRQVEAVGAYHNLTDDPQWLDLGKRTIDGLKRLLIDKGEFAYFNRYVLAPGEAAQEVSPIPPPLFTVGSIWMGVSLITFHRMTGYEPALEMGYKMAKFYQLGHGGFVGPNGEFRHNHACESFDPDVVVHFHTNTLLRILLLEAGLAKGDKGLIELARVGYECGKEHGETLMGYFPENLGPAPGAACNTTEFCEVAEMTYLALRLSTAGVADYWDDADRWLRNMWAEGQLLETDWAYEYSEKHGVPVEKPYSTTDHVPERYRGGVGTCLRPSDWQGNPELSSEACCVGNASIALYKIWRDMIGYDAGKNRLSVNLLMNRASQWADINSHIPHRGQVDVTLKCDCEVALRIPEWTTPQDCKCTVNGQDVQPQWEGRYAVVGAHKGDEVTLRCPISERSERLTFPGKNEDGTPTSTSYDVTVRGNEIVDINPPGERHPIFQRPHYREEETRWKTVEHFVSDSIVETY